MAVHMKARGLGSLQAEIAGSSEMHEEGERVNSSFLEELWARNH